MQCKESRPRTREVPPLGMFQSGGGPPEQREREHERDFSLVGTSTKSFHGASFHDMRESAESVPHRGRSMAPIKGSGDAKHPTARKKSSSRRHGLFATLALEDAAAF